MRAFASPATQTAADQAAVDSAMKEYEDAKRKEAALEAQADEILTKLDYALANEEAASVGLRNRAVAMYRVGEVDFIAALFSSESFTELMARWDLMVRIGQKDADTLSNLRTARAQAQKTANNLMALQEKQAQQVDELSNSVAAAKKKLSASKAAQQAYAERMAAADAAAKKLRKPVSKNPPQPTNPPSGSQPSGSGQWKTALASHYSKTFTGRGASGQAIGPYSMMVAHKTLPFGTLIEFRYKGKIAVASVQDRGPYSGAREFDLGPGVVRVLGFSGVHNVEYRIISR